MKHQLTVVSMRYQLTGPATGPGHVDVSCLVCGWRKRVWGLTARRWRRARSVVLRHYWLSL